MFLIDFLCIKIYLAGITGTGVTHLTAAANSVTTLNRTAAAASRMTGQPLTSVILPYEVAIIVNCQRLTTTGCLQEWIGVHESQY